MSHCCEAARAWARSAAGREFTVCRALPPRPLFAPSAPPRFSPRDPWVLAWLSCTGTAAPLVLSSDSCLTLVFGSDFWLLPWFSFSEPCLVSCSFSYPCLLPPGIRSRILNSLSTLPEPLANCLPSNCPCHPALLSVPCHCSLSLCPLSLFPRPAPATLTLPLPLPIL